MSRMSSESVLARVLRDFQCFVRNCIVIRRRLPEAALRGQLFHSAGGCPQRFHQKVLRFLGVQQDVEEKLSRRKYDSA